MGSQIFGGKFVKLRGALMVCGTTSDAGKSFLVAGLCRLLARQGVRVAPFKAQNMANNASVTADGAEIGHAQWLQAVAAGVGPVSAMNPILLKPTSERTSQVVVRGRPLGEMSADAYHRLKPDLRPMVLEALDELRASYDVVICEGAGSPAEINLLDRDIVNLSLAEDADMPAIVVGDIDRGGVFAALYGTVALLPAPLRSRVKGFVVNKLRGDPQLLGSACADLEARCGVPTLGVIPYVPGPDLDGEDSLTLDNQTSLAPWNRPGEALGSGAAVGHDTVVPLEHESSPDLPRDAVSDSIDRPRSRRTEVLDVVAIRWPLVANAGDLDPLRVEPHARVRWVRSPAELGRPDLIVLPGSKATRSDLDWFHASGLADAMQTSGAPIVGICAGLQMCGISIDDPDGVEGPPGTMAGLGWLPVVTTFKGDKVLDRPAGKVIDGPGQGQQVTGYRIHHGRVQPTHDDHMDGALPRAGSATQGRTAPSLHTSTRSPTVWLVADDGRPLGWCDVRKGSSDAPAPYRNHDGASADANAGNDPRPGTLAEPGGWSQPSQSRDAGRTPPRDRNQLGRYVFGTTLHALFEDDGFREAFLAWVALRAGKAWTPSGVSFEALRQDRLDRIANTLETHLDMGRLSEIIALGATNPRASGNAAAGTERSAGPHHTTATEPSAGAEHSEAIAT